MNKRVDYIDLIKGVTIWGVVWFHTYHPEWLTALLVNSIFFFLSGFFFKRSSFNSFLKKKVKTLLVPFAFFYLLSYVFQMMVYLWDFKTVSGYDWLVFKEIFTSSSRTDYLFVNVVLWFIICLFIIQFFYFFISYLDKRLIAIIALLCLGLQSTFLSISTPFMINAALFYMGFFALGNLIGRSWIEKLKDGHFRKTSLVISAFLSTLLFIPINSFTGWWYDTAYQLKLFMVFFILMSIASCFNEKRYLYIFQFYGNNSLIVMGLHNLIIIFLHRLDHSMGIYEGSPLRGFIQSIFIMAILYVVILFCNKYIPFLVGKKHAERALNRTEAAVKVAEQR